MYAQSAAMSMIRQNMTASHSRIFPMTGSARDAVSAKISSTQPDTESEISERKDPLNKWVFFDVHHDNHSGGRPLIKL